MQEKVGLGKGLVERGVAGEWEKEGLEGVKGGEKWGEKGLEWLWDKGLAERKCRRKKVRREGDGGRWGWIGGRWDGMGWGNWEMGMISDCYQLQENQRKNGPLAVKTPSPPCTGSPPAGWAQGGRWRAHCLRLILRRRRSLPPAPLPCFPIRGRSQAGRKSRKALRVNGSGRMPKRYKFQH